jgi:hypothetical protein
MGGRPIVVMNCSGDNLLRTIHKANKHPLKTLVGYVRYRKLFSDCGIELKNCEISLRVNIILLINKKKLIVYRCSLNRLGHIAISRNYDFLQSSKVCDAPQPRGLWHKGDVIVSAESLVAGERLRPDEVDAKITEKIFGQLYSIYRQYKVVIDFDVDKWFGEYDYFLRCYSPLWVDRLNVLREMIVERSAFSRQRKNNHVANTCIHGDLTFRNVILSGDRVVFIDFDRWGVDFPEFDIFLFYIDNLTHRQTPVKCETFFTHIIQLIKGQMNVPEIETLYNVNPEFEVNRQFDQDIRNLFLYRTLVHILQSFDNREGRPLRLLDKIVNEF